jgi:hypothetical protein
VTAPTHHHRVYRSRGLLALGLPPVLGVLLLAGGGRDAANAPTAAPPDAASCVTDPATPPVSVDVPFIWERGLHRVNSPVPRPAVPVSARFSF